MGNLIFGSLVVAIIIFIAGILFGRRQQTKINESISTINKIKSTILKRAE